MSVEKQQVTPAGASAEGEPQEGATTQSDANPTAQPQGGSGSRERVDLTQFEEFRRWQSEMDKKLQTLAQERDALKQAVEKLTQQLEATQAGREFDTVALSEIKEMLERETQTKAHIKALERAWASHGLTPEGAPEVYAKLQAASSPEEADQIVYEWLTSRLSQAQPRTEAKQTAETGVDESPIPASTAPMLDDFEEQVKRWREEATQGRSRLRDFLMATEPLLRQKRAGRTAKL